MQQIHDKSKATGKARGNAAGKAASKKRAPPGYSDK
jgi:hypothetical protein